jgi:DNA-binding MarR family transcriptional regulator
MSKAFQELAGLDRLIHEPARLAVLTALESCREADFLFLQRLTGLSKGNLSSHLAKLEEAGLVNVAKDYNGKAPRTRVSLSAAGRASVAKHWRRLAELRGRATAWVKREEES